MEGDYNIQGIREHVPIMILLDNPLAIFSTHQSTMKPRAIKVVICHTRFLCQNQILIICMTQDQLFHTYGQKCSQIAKCYE
jgi:hypothetical protein